MDHLLPDDSAPQHERAPRPLPLFLEMVRAVGERDPTTARKALAGLTDYERAPRPRGRTPRPVVMKVGPAVLRDHGGDGPPAILVPSLINPPHVLDLDEDVSLASAVARMGRRSLLLDWGAARERADLDVGGHVENLLVPLIEQLEQPPALIGYCLGGTMAIGAANLTPVERVVTVAAPWHFSDYPEDSRAALQDLWRSSKAAAASLKVLADGSPASGLLVARPVANGIEIRELRGARHRGATKCGGSSSSKIGRTRGRPFPSPQRAS